MVLISFSKTLWFLYIDNHVPELPRCSVVKNPPVNAGDTGSISALGRSPEGRNGNPLQYSYLENSIDRGVLWAIIHAIAKSQTHASSLVGETGSRGHELRQL